MTKKDKKKKKKPPSSSTPSSSNPSNLWRSPRDRKQTIIPEPPGADLICNQQREYHEKKRQQKYRTKKNPKLKPRGPYKKKSTPGRKSNSSNSSNPNSLPFLNNSKQANKVRKEKIMDVRNKLRDVPRSPHNKHSKAPLMRIIDIFNQENWREIIKQLNTTSSSTKQLETVDPEVRRVNLEWMMKDHHPTKILHKRFNKLYCEIMGKVCRSSGTTLRILQGVNNLLTSADLTTRQRWKIFNGLKDNPGDKIKYLNFGEEELPAVEFGEMRQDNLMAKVDFRIRYINTKKGMQLLENQRTPLVPKEEIGDYIGAEDLGDRDVMEISSKFVFDFLIFIFDFVIFSLGENPYTLLFDKKKTLNPSMIQDIIQASCNQNSGGLLGDRMEHYKLFLCGRKNQKNVEAFTLKLNKIYNGGARNIQQYYRGRGTVIRKPNGGIRVIWNPEPVFQILSKIVQFELEGKSNIFYDDNAPLKGTSISHVSPIQLTKMVLLNYLKFSYLFLYSLNFLG